MHSPSSHAADKAAFRQFHRHLGTRPALPAANQRRLLQAARLGDRQARAALVEVNLRLIVWVARRERRHLTQMEALQEGAVALLEAIEGYDPKRAQFSTYAAHRIRNRYRELAKRETRGRKREGLAG